MACCKGSATFSLSWSLTHTQPFEQLWRETQKRQQRELAWGRQAGIRGWDSSHAKHKGWEPRRQGPLHGTMLFLDVSRPLLGWARTPAWGRGRFFRLGLNTSRSLQSHLPEPPEISIYHFPILKLINSTVGQQLPVEVENKMARSPWKFSLFPTSLIPSPLACLHHASQCCNTALNNAAAATTLLPAAQQASSLE